MKSKIELVTKRLRNFWNNKKNNIPQKEFLEVLVATILSQNTSDKNSSKAYFQLKLSYPTWESLRMADAQELQAVIRTAGLAKQKSYTIINCLKKLYERYPHFEFKDLATKTDEAIISELTELKGVGVKTAACVLLFALGRDICPVDTHVNRILQRLNVITLSNADKVFYRLKDIMPANCAKDFHVDLIKYGRAVCRSQSPYCGSCGLYDICDWKEKGYYSNNKFDKISEITDFFLIDVI